MTNTAHTYCIIGGHALASSFAAQFQQLGYEETAAPERADAIALLEGSDEKNLSLLLQLAHLRRQQGDGSKPVCHLLLRSADTLQAFRTMGSNKDVNETLDVNPFTIEDTWAQHVAGGRAPFLPLDRGGIAADSNATVHLVVCGLAPMGMLLAINTARVAHYPNYVRDHSKRTRITIIDEDMEKALPGFLERHRQLMQNSYYRVMDLRDGKAERRLHLPLYEGRREDFVDVEWEFVSAAVEDERVGKKLDSWLDNDGQYVTIAICTEDEMRNVRLADVVSKRASARRPDDKNQILPYVKSQSVARLFFSPDSGSLIKPFGMLEGVYDVRLPLVELGKRLMYFYDCCFNDKKHLPTDMPMDEVERLWQACNNPINKHSNIYHVMTLPGKMRSLGHSAADWDTFYALTEEEIDLLAAVEHNRWSVERLLAGVAPCNDKQREEIRGDIKKKSFYKTKNAHYDLCAYNELDVDATGKNVKEYDRALTACIPIIMKSYKDGIGHN